MPNAKDFNPQEGRKFLVYGRTGAGKSTALLTLPGKKFVYVCDPAGMAALAGHDIDYELFIPDMVNIKKGKFGAKSQPASMIRPDPKTYLRFEEDFEQRANDGFFDQYDVVAFESLTTLMDMMMWYILDMQGRGNSAPEIADYYYRSDGMKNIVRVAAASVRTVYCSAHVETKQDEVTKRIETSLFLPGALKAGLPLMFSEVLHLFADSTGGQSATHYAQFQPTRAIPTIRTSLRNMKLQEEITVDWSQPLEGQGLGALYSTGALKTPEQLREENAVNMGGAKKQ